MSLLSNGVPQTSVVYAPILEQKFTAVKNRHTKLNGKKVDVTKVKNLKEALVSFGKGTTREDVRWFSNIITEFSRYVRTFRHYGACGLEIAYVSAGMIDLYINEGSNIYDYAPGSLLVREAGGVVLNDKGEDWKIGDDLFIAGNKHLAAEALELLN